MRALLLVAAVLGVAVAQEPPKQPFEYQIIQLKYANPDDMYKVLLVFENACNIRVNQQVRTISLRCLKEVMPAVQDAVKRLDVPPPASRDLELTAYFLVTSDKPEGSGTAVPPELDGVVKQIRSVLKLKDVHLFESLQIRAGAGRGGQVNGKVGGMATDFRIQSWSVRPGDKDVVSIEQMRASVTDTGLRLDRIDIPVSQKVVIGRSSMNGPNKEFIVVLSAKLL